jgi:hypothetical protein
MLSPDILVCGEQNSQSFLPHWFMIEALASIIITDELHLH